MPIMLFVILALIFVILLIVEPVLTESRRA